MNRNSIWVTAAILVALPLTQAQAGVRKAGPLTVADEGMRTLEDLKQQAAVLESAADELKMFSADLYLDSDAQLPQLAALKTTINSMGSELRTLEAEQEALSAWEQQAIAQTLPILKDSAANTQSAIEYFNENRSHLWAGGEYRGYADRIWKDSELMKKELKTYVALAKLRVEEHRLGESLEQVSAD